MRNSNIYQSCNDLQGFFLPMEINPQVGLSIGTWKERAGNKAKRAGKSCVGQGRQSRRPWRFVLPLNVVNSELVADKQWKLDWKDSARL